MFNENTGGMWEKVKEWSQIIGIFALSSFLTGILLAIGILVINTVSAGQKISLVFFLKTPLYTMIWGTPVLTLSLACILSLDKGLKWISRWVKNTYIKIQIVSLALSLLIFICCLPILFITDAPVSVGLKMILFLLISFSCILWIIALLRSIVIWVGKNFIYLNGGRVPKVYVCENNGVKGIVLRRDLDLARNKAWTYLELCHMRTDNIMLEVAEVMTFVRADKFDPEKYTGTYQDYEALLRNAIHISEKFVVPNSSNYYGKGKYITLQEAYKKIYGWNWSRVMAQKTVPA